MKPLATAIAVGISFRVFVSFGHCHASKIVRPLELIPNKPRLLRREQLNGVSKGGEHPLCNILIGAGVNTPAAKWFRLICLINAIQRFCILEKEASPMNTKIAVSVLAFLVFLSAHVADAQQPAASLGLTLQSLEVGSTKDCDDAIRVATNSGAQAFIQRDHPIIGNERKRITGLALKNRLEASCLTGQTASTYTGVVKSIYPIEKVGVIARSVTFPNVLNHGQAIMDTKYPNASILCLEVANYSGLVTGLIWSMDRELVEEHDLQYLIDRASRVEFTCVLMLMPRELLKTIVEQQMGQGLPEEHATPQDNIVVQVANPDAAIAASPEIEEKTPAVSMEDAKKAVVAQIEKIQEIIRFAQTVESKQNE